VTRLRTYGTGTDPLRETAPEVPILVVTGHSLETELHQLTARRRVGYVQKPFRIEALREAIEALMAGTARSRTARGSPR